MSNEEKRNALVKKLQAELDEFVKLIKTNDQIISSAATIDNCIEIIFALSEYGDDLDISESDYDKLLSSGDHTLMALNDRYLSSEYHTNDSMAILDFIKGFAKEQTEEAIHNYGDTYYSQLTQSFNREKTTAPVKDFRLDYTTAILDAFEQSRIFNIKPTAESDGKVTVWNVYPSGSDTSIATINLRDERLSLNEFHLISNNEYALKEFWHKIGKDISNYNKSFEFPDIPGNKSVRESGYRILNMANDTVLAIEKNAYGFQYAVWDYDREYGGCTNGHYFSSYSDDTNKVYDYAYDHFIKRSANVSEVFKRGCYLSFDELSEIVPQLAYSAINSRSQNFLYRIYDEQLADIYKEKYGVYNLREQGMYPVSFSDAELLMNAPEELSGKLWGFNDSQNYFDPYKLNDYYDASSYGYILADKECASQGYERFQYKYLEPIKKYNELIEVNDYSEEDALNHVLDIYGSLLENDNSRK